MTTRKRQTEASDPPRRRRPGGRNAEVREAVRRAALELLAEGGFGAVSLPAVARRAGVHKTTLYRNWSTPAALVDDAIAELEALALPDLDTGSLEGDLEAFVLSRLRLVREPHAQAILRAVIGAGEAPSALFEWVEAFWKPRRREWRSPIERAIERGARRLGPLGPARRARRGTAAAGAAGDEAAAHAGRCRRDRGPDRGGAARPARRGLSPPPRRVQRAGLARPGPAGPNARTRSQSFGAGSRTPRARIGRAFFLESTRFLE